MSDKEAKKPTVEELEKQLEEINTELDIAQFESVDQIVSNEILAIESDNFDKATLLEIYNGLE